tara:strand:+ start:31208 stop:32584 length:1377 start_codon:yes stop_codon:yes gene_type:complete
MSTNTTFDVTNPYDGSSIGTFPYAQEDEVARKLATLTKGKAILAGLSAHKRSTILAKLADLMEAASEEFAALITREIGKTIRDSRVEMVRAANTIRCSANEARSVVGEVLDSDAYPPERSKWGIVHRRPLGIILAITPFNFPINLSVHKIGPAFAAGCPVFFKPSPQNYLSGKMLTELCHQAGMPEEAIQFCMPDIPEITKVVAGDDVQIISFTGGVPASKAIARNAGGKKLLFELGGNDPLIVMADGDVDLAVKTAINQRFGTAGQRCTAAKRVFVHSSVYDAFRDKLVVATKALVVGDPMADETFVGPVVNTQAANVVEERIAAAIADGAKLLTGGTRDGNLIAPTVLENVSPASELVADETFGPVIPLFRFDDIDDAIGIINGTGFGLQSGVFTNDLRIIRKLFDELEVGALAVNDGPGFRAEHFPFGGIGNSGLGREGVRYAMEEMTYLKTLIM